MKKITFIIAIIGIYCNCLAQDIIHYPTPALDKFVGTWVYNNDGIEVEIILKKVQVDIPHKNMTIEVLEGYHIYKRNNKMMENWKEKGEVSLSNGLPMERDNPNVIRISIADAPKQKMGYAMLTYIPGERIKLQCDLINREGVRFNKPGEPKFDDHFTLPESMLFYKQ